MAEADEQVALARARRGGDRLQHLRAVLPCEVLVTASTHPLWGQSLEALSFKRQSGKLLLIVTLPDGSPGTISADATNVFSDGAPAEPAAPTTLSVEGIRQLRVLVLAQPRSRRSRGTGQPAT